MELFSVVKWYKLEESEVKNFINYKLKTYNDQQLPSCSVVEAVLKLVEDMKSGFKVVKCGLVSGGILKMKLMDGRFVVGKDYHEDWSAITLDGCARFFTKIEKNSIKTQKGKRCIEDVSLEELIDMFVDGSSEPIKIYGKFVSSAQELKDIIICSLKIEYETLERRKERLEILENLNFDVDKQI